MNLKAKASRECCCGCGTEIPAHPGKGRWAYLSPEHASPARRRKQKGYWKSHTDRYSDEWLRADAKWRKFKSENGLKNPICKEKLALQPFERSCPADQSSLYDRSHALRKHLASGNRRLAETQAKELLLDIQNDKTPFGFRVAAHCEEILLACGLPGRDAATFDRLDKLATRIESRYVLIDESLRLAIALTVHANLFRIRGDYEKSVKYLMAALWKITTYHDSSDESFRIIKHQILLWLVRNKAIHLGNPDSAWGDWNELRKITTEVGTSSIGRQTLLEGIGYYQAMNDFPKADRCVEGVKKLTATSTHLPIIDQQVHRASILLGFAKYGKMNNEVQEGLVKYNDAVAAYPNSYHLEILTELCAGSDVKPALSLDAGCVFSTPILTPLYLETKLDRLY